MSNANVRKIINSPKTKRIINSSVERQVNYETGEVVSETTTNVIRLPQEPPYIKMYIDDLCLLANIPESQKQVLILLLKKMDYEGFITLSPRYRKSICEKLKIKDQTFRNRMVSLCKSGMIYRHSTNEYEVNPHYFARGEWRSICERRGEFELRIKYSENGRIIEAGELKPVDDEL